MNLQSIVSECAAAGIKIIVNGDAVSLEGEIELVQRYASVLRPYKAQLLAESWHGDLVREFMEIDGLSREEARAMAAVSVRPRPPAEWRQLIDELDSLIAQFCRAFQLSDGAKALILEIRKKQSLASIPVSVDWFRRELEEAGRGSTGAPSPAADSGQALPSDGKSL